MPGAQGPSLIPAHAARTGRAHPESAMPASQYQLDATQDADTLRLTLRGSSDRETAAAIAGDVQDLIARHSARRVLIDMRKLEGRLSTFETHALVRAYRRDLTAARIAVIDLESNRFVNRFHEQAAADHGFQFRFFENPAEAESWLRGEAR